MSDYLIAQLRRRASLTGRAKDGGQCLDDKAADAIEELTRANADLQVNLTGTLRTCRILKAERDQWEARADAHVEMWLKLSREISDTRAQVERLKAIEHQRDEAVEDLQVALLANRELRAEIERLKGEVAMLTTERTRLINVADDISRRLASEMAENERLKAEIVDITEAFENWEGSFDRLRAACGGLSPEAHEWAVRIAADAIALADAGNWSSPDAYACPPEVRAELTKASPASRAQITGAIDG